VREGRQAWPRGARTRAASRRHASSVPRRRTGHVATCTDSRRSTRLGKASTGLGRPSAGGSEAPPGQLPEGDARQPPWAEPLQGQARPAEPLAAAERRDPRRDAARDTPRELNDGYASTEELSGFDQQLRAAEEQRRRSGKGNGKGGGR
jgi:hypothetical protein